MTHTYKVGDVVSEHDTTDAIRCGGNELNLPTGTILQGPFGFYIKIFKGYSDRVEFRDNKILLRTRIVRYLPSQPLAPPKVGDIITVEQIKALPDNSTMLYTLDGVPREIYIKKDNSVWVTSLESQVKSIFDCGLDYLILRNCDEVTLLYIGEES